MALTRTSLSTASSRASNAQATAVTLVAGDAVTVRVAYLNGGGTPGTNSIADTAGNTWTKQREYNVGGTGQTGATIFTCIAAASGSSTITVTNSNAGAIAFAIAIDSWSGHAGFGSTADNDAPASHDVNPPADVVLNALGVAPASGDYTISVNASREFAAMTGAAASGWTVDYTGRETGGAVVMFWQHQIRTGSTSTTVTHDLVTGDEFEDCAVAIVVKALAFTTGVWPPPPWRNPRRAAIPRLRSSLKLSLAPGFAPPKAVGFAPIGNKRRAAIPRAHSSLILNLAPGFRPPVAVNFPPIGNVRRRPPARARSSLIVVLPPGTPPATAVIPTLPVVLSNRRRVPVGRPRTSLVPVFVPGFAPPVPVAYPLIVTTRRRVPVGRPRTSLIPVFVPGFAPPVPVWFPPISNRRRVPVGRPRTSLVVPGWPVVAYVAPLTFRRRVPVGKARSSLIVVLAPAAAAAVTNPAWVSIFRNPRRYPPKRPRRGLVLVLGVGTPPAVFVQSGRCWGWVEVTSTSTVAGVTVYGWVELESTSEVTGATSFGYLEEATTSEGELVS